MEEETESLPQRPIIRTPSQAGHSENGSRARPAEAGGSDLFAWLLARRDQLASARSAGRRPVSPLLALVHPVVYLWVRGVRDERMRSLRPCWTAIGLTAVAWFVLIMCFVSMYGRWRLGY